MEKKKCNKLQDVFCKIIFSIALNIHEPLGHGLYICNALLVMIEVWIFIGFIYQCGSE